ncbi:MAG: DNA primase, partial [Terrabacter sp.]|nr:DNA primase [Terrabacter sp.]
MAGLINSEDIAAVKARSSIEDVVREHVTLRSAGPGSLKGLCPFHDEKSPSFNIRPAVGAWHCFGCGEGGDVISFVQKVDHLSFSEAVERLAQKLGMELRYENGDRPREEGLGRRSRLVEAHRVAEEYYTELLLGSPGARQARDFLRARDFNSEHVKQFGVGFAPRGGEDLVRHLRAKGFTDDELVTGGIAGRGARGLYDRFRGRLVWPIRDITGDTVGFGARRIFDDDRIDAKYLNTSETPIYKKSTVLYGLDLAKKKISQGRRAVVVQGYTDVMACHLAGVETAVATCGTAFGADHIKTLRRLMRDEAGLAPARVIFTFDGDAAGQKAAMRAFADDEKWTSQSFVAVEKSGKDPCELRQAGGDPAVQALIEDAVPMFEFAVRTTIKRFDVETAEGRIQAVRAVAPIIASIRDQSLRPEYTREVSGMLGLDVEQVATE